MSARQIVSTLAALAVVILAGSFPARSDSVFLKGTYEPKTDRPGSDYMNFNVTTGNPVTCQIACSHDDRCRAWTYVNPGIQGPTGRCWLKTAIPAAKTSTCCVSGKIESPKGTGLSADATALLNAHNGYRAKHCVPALAWSAQLAASAQAWANACTKNGSSFAHSPGAWQSQNGYGENLAWGGSLSAKGAVDLWYAEIKSYNFGAPAWSGAVGHFTQVVWKGSRQVGCAVATCGGQKLWVCQYSPTGNWNTNQPGVLASNVPAACK